MRRSNAQLVGGKDGVERWAQSYDRRDPRYAALLKRLKFP